MKARSLKERREKRSQEAVAAEEEAGVAAEAGVVGAAGHEEEGVVKLPNNEGDFVSFVGIYVVWNTLG